MVEHACATWPDPLAFAIDIADLQNACHAGDDSVSPEPLLDALDPILGSPDTDDP